ncbi:MAG: hypothetical protein JRJ62_03320 [Deltaproteobacteria bacterium]|nr:hypothetical protein [Deltaproteobacteria bacterium]MBW2090346.1 hypothetical protein [Deltaproteobacteria bacterium]
MGISDSYRDMIVNEVNFCIEQMEKRNDFRDKLYYFSGIQGLLQRIFNLEYDSDLVFAFFIFKSTHEAFMNRYSAIQKGGDTVVLLFQEQFDELIEGAKEFADKIKNKKDFNNTLKKFVVLSYSTTGNGYYLMQKGLLKV